MARPRYHLRPSDWFDVLDWLTYQLNQPDWLTNPEHPVHRSGIRHLADRVEQLRHVSVPTHPDCQLLQAYLNECLARHDWDKLRKTLSARRRRRREKRTQQAPINVTLSPDAHHWLKQLVRAGGFATLSEAVEGTLPDLVATLESQARDHRYQDLAGHFARYDAPALCGAVEYYLEQTSHQRSLATACRIAYQWYLGAPDAHKEALLRERFLEDLVWNESHLGWPVAVFLSDLDGNQQAH
ncbi:MAG: hypothetical protein ACX931_00550 [Saccharospirillum sp.]